MVGKNQKITQEYKIKIFQLKLNWNLTIKLISRAAYEHQNVWSLTIKEKNRKYRKENITTGKDRGSVQVKDWSRNISKYWKAEWL